MKTLSTLSFIALSSALFSPLASAATTITGIGDGSAFTVNGTASVAAGEITLTTDPGGTQAGTAYATAKQDITSFTTSFRYRHTGSNPADGWTFAIQNDAVTKVGGSAGGHGYSGTSSSVAVSFNINGDDSSSAGSNGNKTALLATAALAPTNILTDADITVNYDGTTLSWTVTNHNDALQTQTRMVDVDIETVVGASTAWIGFTGGTGGRDANQVVSDFSYTTPVPEPSGALLLGLTGIFGLARRRR